MDKALCKLLYKVSDPNGSQHTHHSYFQPKSNWTFANGSYGIFWNEYCTLVNSETNPVLCLGEIPGENIPVISKVILKYKKSFKGDTCTEGFLYTLVQCYQDVIDELCVITKHQAELKCCILQPIDDYNKGDYIYTYFQLIFPYCVVKKSFIKTIHKNVIDNAKQQNILKLLHCQPENNWDKILDINIAEKAWPLYKSIEEIGQPVAEYIGAHGYITDEELESLSFEQINLKEFFIPGYHSHFHNNQANQKIFSTKFGKGEQNRWLPLLFSLSYHPVITKIKTLATPASTPPPRGPGTHLGVVNHTQTMREFDSSKGNVDLNEEQLSCETLLRLLDQKRLGKENFWIDIGKSLYNTFKGSKYGLILWKKYTFDSKTTELATSSSSDSYESLEDTRLEKTEYLWPSFKTKNYITFKTIAWYARKDNFESYKEWHNDYIRSALINASKRTHTDVAEAFYKIYFLDFLCVNPAQRIWYTYYDQSWVIDNNSTHLKSRISNSFLKIFQNFRTKISGQIETAENSDRLEVLIGELSKLVRSLKTQSFKTNIVKELMEFFDFQKNFTGIPFEKVANANKNLLALSNVVIECGSKKAFVRQGKPEDYLTIASTTHWNYSYNWGHKKVKQVMYWMRQMFNSKALIDYNLKFGASCLQSGNNNKIFPIKTGDGDNSKSMYKKLYEAGFGPYSANIPVSLLINKRGDSSKATPELARLVYAKIAWLQEPGDDTGFKNGILKELTGGDTFFARLLHSNGGDMEATFTMVVLCNQIPLIQGADKATKKRLRIFPFNSEWVDKAPLSEAEQFKQRKFPMDEHFDRKIPSMASAFMWILVQYWAKYRAEGLSPPETVTKATKQYWADNDIYLIFTKERIKKATKLNNVTNKQVTDLDACMTIIQVYKEFSDWYKSSYPSGRCPTRQTFVYQLSQRWGPPQVNVWRGIKQNYTMATLEEM